jgi:hypothetical protein
VAPTLALATWSYGLATRPCRSRSGLICSGSWSFVGVAGWDAALSEFGEHGGVVDAQMLADSCQGPVKVVEMDGVVDLIGR